jgi:hypothetical protein
MDGSNGTITVEFADSGATPTPEMLELINNSLPVGSKLTRDGVFVRAMYVTSDAVNTQGGRFRSEDLSALSSLISGVPVMIGHDKSKLPIGRCFKSELVERSGAKWAKAWFYWLKDCSEADDLRAKIDGGICNECSLSFSFSVPECSICGGDIRKCSHLAGKTYRDELGDIKVCHFIYAGIKTVNEISLVYRGAVPGTAITRLKMHQDTSSGSCNSDHACSGPAGEVILDLAAAEMIDSEATTWPVYHGIPIRLTPTDRQVYTDLPGRWADHEAIRQIVTLGSDELAVLGEAEGVVVFMRGRSRLPLYAVENAQHFIGRSCRCRIKLYADANRRDELSKSTLDKLESCGIDVIRRTVVNDAAALAQAASIAPHEGLRIVMDGSRLTYRPQSRLLLAARDIIRHQAGRFCYDLAFGSEPDVVFRSYESRIPADIGDTLYVDATLDSTRRHVVLQKITVLDNLKTYFRPDSKLRRSSEESSEQYELYALAPDKAALRLVSDSKSLCVLFTSFSVKQLLLGKTLVGHGLPNGDDAQLRHCLERGNVAEFDGDSGGRILSFRGRAIKGDFVIRPAVLLKERVWLLHRAA